MKGTSLESPDKSKLFLCAVGTIPEQLGHCCCHLQNQEPRSRSSSGGTFSGSLLVLRAISLCIVLFPSVSGAVGTVVMKKEIHSIQPFSQQRCVWHLKEAELTTTAVLSSDSLASDMT